MRLTTSLSPLLSTLRGSWWHAWEWVSWRRVLVPGSRSTYVCAVIPFCAESPHSASHSALFYTRQEIGLRTAYWHGFATVAGAFSGLLGFGIQHAHTGIANWKLLFIIEGVPTILLGLCAMAILPDRPEYTGMFNEKERELAFERRDRGRKGDVGRVIQKCTLRKATLPTSFRLATHTQRPHSPHRLCVQGLEGTSRVHSGPTVHL